MSLSNGERIGPYEVVGLLGAGGMGEVYEARDPRLGRSVAIKVLPSSVADDPERQRRFDREARALGALNHPNLMAVFDSGVHEGVSYLVFERLQGETLRQRLARGALPVRKAVDYATQIARGLAAAHDKGVVHRDLKPENTFLAQDGRVKILDFGLARLRPEVDGEAETAAALTEAGRVLGTVGYMSPEQVTGGPMDHRSDIFSAGSVLYEMLAGRRPFRGDSAVETMNAILKEDPAALPQTDGPIPPTLERILMRCLEKDPDRRFRSAHDLAFALDSVAGLSGSGSRPATGMPSGRTPWWRIPALGAALVLAALAGVVAGRAWRTTPVRDVGRATVRSSVDLPPGTELTDYGFTRAQLALSLDGRVLVWSARATGAAFSSALYQRPLDRDVVQTIPGTAGASQPFLSPDGRWVGFYDGSRKRLRKIPVEGGLAVDLGESDVLEPMGACWTVDGKIVLGHENQGLDWIPAEGGAPRVLTTVDRAREIGHRLPWVLPGGKAILFTAVPHPWGVRARVEAVSLASGNRKVLVEDAADARYLASGHLVFARQGVLMAAPFDPDRLEIEGKPVPVVDDVRQSLNVGNSSLNSGAAQFAVSAAGLLVYASGGLPVDPPAEPFLVDRGGRIEPLAGFDKPMISSQVRFSPDGRQVAFDERARSGLAWVFDVERQTHRPLSREGIAGSPVWSPDGTRIAMTWSAAGPLSLWLAPAEGGSPWERLTEGDDWPSSWTPDGGAVVFVRERPDNSDILVYRFEDRQVVPLLATEAKEAFPAVSPDGRWLAYVSSESGRDEVLVTSFPDRKRTLVVSREGADSPAWSRDGRELFYLAQEPVGDGPPVRPLLSVSVAPGEPLTLGKPAVLFRLPPGTFSSVPTRCYDVHPDGRRFLFVRMKASVSLPAPVTRLHLAQDWFAELARLAPTRR